MSIIKDWSNKKLVNNHVKFPLTIFGTVTCEYFCKAFFNSFFGMTGEAIQFNLIYFSSDKAKYVAQMHAT